MADEPGRPSVPSSAWPWTVGLAVALIGVAAAIWLWRARIDVEGPEIAAGRALYDAHCAACHGANLEGQPDWRSLLPSGRMPAPPHDATGHTWHHSDQVLLTIVRDGFGAFAPNHEPTCQPSPGSSPTTKSVRFSNSSRAPGRAASARFKRVGPRRSSSLAARPPLLRSPSGCPGVRR